MSKIPGNDLLKIVSSAAWSAGIAENNLFRQLADNSVEDCAVLKFNGFDSKLLFSLDFGPPVGKNFRIAGKIAALNAISDIYVKGGIPSYALVILCFSREMPEEESVNILSGIYDICKKEQVEVIGGHTISGSETLIGLSVIGMLDKEKNIVSKQGGYPGDKIWITKPVGSGLAMRGYYHGFLNEADYEEAIDIMLLPNHIKELNVSVNSIQAMTDVTGFGLIGHLTEMLQVGYGAIIYQDSVPTLKSLDKLDPIIMRSSYIRDNIIYASEKCELKFAVDSIRRMALFDPQTNGPVMFITDARSTALPGLGCNCIGEIVDTADIILK